MDSVTFIGTVAGFCTTLSFLPQMIKIHRTKSAHDLSLFMFIIFAFGVASWLVYGVLTGSTPIIAANCVTLVFCGYILFMKVKYGK
ncbi:MAG: SemiSWEET transporter [Candidatus Omnitrophica bacterium]|nr:SemiSWEET transporter [Candidatus Omnitrophota bacterium]